MLKQVDHSHVGQSVEGELYGWLEETVDACKDVAQVIVEIVIKGS